MHSDPIADYLTRIRNAQMAKLAKTVCPHSKLKEQLSLVLKKEGYISDYKVLSADKFKEIEISLNTDNKTTFTRISKPGRRVYTKSKNMPRVLNGYGIAIISTPKGLMSNKEAHKQKLGGEVLCEVY